MADIFQKLIIQISIIAKKIINSLIFQENGKPMSKSFECGLPLCPNIK